MNALHPDSAAIVVAVGDEAAVGEHAVIADLDEVLSTVKAQTDSLTDDARPAERALLAGDVPEAIFAANDMMALGCL